MPDKAIVKMCLLAKEDNGPLGFRACVWDITGLGRFGGFRQQEYAMDAKNEIKLKLISTHSLRVKACVLLAEAGKEGWYIKLRLRWLSDCFEVYIRNTKRITWQHVEALRDINEKMQEIAITMANLPNVLNDATGEVSQLLYELDDED